MELDSQNYILGSEYLIFLFAILIRWCVSLHSYSGEKTPPIFGDYEAQRHWMEVTLNVPIQDWYKDTTDNNLTYWGLDYPPLTAYHSYLCGVVASVFVPQSVELHKSKGYESYSHKLFMRYSVLFVDLLIYMPAVYLYFMMSRKTNESKAELFLTLLYPGLILIDHGHFQYNCTSLGLFVAAVVFVTSGHYKIATILFCLAVNYKQMELYHSLPFFCYFLGKFFLLCQKRTLFVGLKFIVPVSTVVIFTFVAVWFPFLSSLSDVEQVLTRIFPVYRGIYEDKVASFWCIFNIFFKLNNYFHNEQIFRICLVVTLLSVLPSLVDLTWNPSLEKFKLSLIICSLGFFLFSFHVHEKSILLVAVPVALNFSHQPLIASWFLLISTFSMLPLFIKDGLFLPFLSLFIFYFICSLLYFQNNAIQSSSSNSIKYKTYLYVVFNFSLLGCVVISFVSRFYKPPERYPYLWPLLVSFYSFVHFVGIFLYYYSEQCSFSLKKKKN